MYTKTLGEANPGVYKTLNSFDPNGRSESGARRKISIAELFQDRSALCLNLCLNYSKCFHESVVREEFSSKRNTSRNATTDSIFVEIQRRGVEKDYKRLEKKVDNLSI
ncbi:hypothetical protein ANTPLA_LOCUS1548 [Anthophora plagiata]